MDTTPQMREMAQVMELIDSPHDQEAIQRILRSLQYSTFDSPALQPQPLMSNQTAAGAGRTAVAGSADSDSVESLVAALTAGGNPYGQPIYAAMAQQFGPNWAQLGAPLLDDNQLLLAASAAAADVAARTKLGAEVLASRGGAAAAASAGVPASAAGGNSLLSGGPTPGLLTGHQLLLDDAKDMDPATMAEIDEDTVQITRMVIKIEPLHEETLRAIMVPWNEAVPEEQLTPSYLRSSVVDTIRYLAAVYLLTVADKYRCLPANDDRLELINNLMLSLWQGIGLLQPNVRDHIAQLLGVATPATADSICVAVTGLGIHSFFAALEPPVLERVCQELRLENCPPLRGAADPDALAPVYCDAIACHFYPTLRNQELGRCCFVRTTVHENGPGSFTCTVDTACLLSMMGLRSYVSNEFHCTSGGVKLPFRVKLQVNRVSKLSFFLCQRRVPGGVKAKLILRSASEAKARKAASLGGPNAVLFKESTGIVDSEMHFGFTDLISVADVLAADTTRGGVGPRGLYNQNEDRLVFQFSLSFDPPAAHLLAEPAATAAPVADKEKKKQPQPAGKKASEPPKEVPKTKKEKQAEAAAAALALEEEEQRERRAREAQKLQQLRQKRIQAFEKEEQAERDKFTQSQAASWGALCEEAKKSYQKELQRQRDRERKAELARMMPLVELQQQVQQLQQQVTQAKQALHKAQTEKNAMAKEATRAAAALAEREAAIEQEQREIDEAEEELLRVDEELEKAEMELKARHEQEEVTRRQRSIDPLAQGAGGTARIDMTSFWFTSGSSPAAGNAPGVTSSAPASSTAPGQLPNRAQPAVAGHGSPGSGRARNAPVPAAPAPQGVLQGLNGTPLSPSAVAPPPFSATSSSPQPGTISATASGVTGPLLGPTLTGSSPLPNVPSFMPHTRIPSSPAMQPPVHPPPHLHHQQQQHASHQTAAALLHQHHQLAPHLPHGIMGSAPPYQPPQHGFPSMRPPLSMLPSDGMFGGPSQSTMAPPPSFASGGNMHHPAPGAFGRGFTGETGLAGAFPPRWGPPAAPATAGGSGALLQISSPLPAAESMLNGPGPAPSFMRGQIPAAPPNNGAGSTSAAPGSGLELGVW